MNNIHGYGTKKRLFELMSKINGVVLSEGKLSKKTKEDIVRDFYGYVDKEIKIGEEKPKIELIDDKSYTYNNRSFASYNPNTYEIIVYSGDRVLADVLRSLAHELVHHKQNVSGELNPDSGKTGSKHENQANVLAGNLMREYAKIKPDIFE